MGSVTGGLTAEDRDQLENTTVGQTARRIHINAMAWLTSGQHALLHIVCYHAEFGRSTSNRVCISSGEPQIGERCNSALLGWEARLITRYTPLPTYVTLLFHQIK